MPGELAYIINLGGGERPGYPLPTPPLYPTGGPVPPGINVPPPGVWPPPPSIDNGLPPEPPGGIIGGQLPVYPSLPIYPDVPPVGSTLPELPPGLVWPPLPPQIPVGKVVALVIVFGVGYRWAVLDLSLKPGLPLPPVPEPK